MPENQKRIVKSPANPANYMIAIDPTVTKKFVRILKPWTSAEGRHWKPDEIAGFDSGDPAQLAVLNNLLQTNKATYWNA